MHHSPIRPKILFCDCCVSILNRKNRIIKLQQTVPRRTEDVPMPKIQNLLQCEKYNCCGNGHNTRRLLILLNSIDRTRLWPLSAACCTVFNNYTSYELNSIRGGWQTIPGQSMRSTKTMCASI